MYVCVLKGVVRTIIFENVCFHICISRQL